MRSRTIVTWGLVAAVLGSAAAAAAEDGAKPARLLVVTVTTGFRHASIATAEPVLEELGRTTGLFHADFFRMPPGRPPAPRAPKRAAGTSDADWQAQEAAFKKEQETFQAADAVWQKGLAEQGGRVFSAAGLDQFDGVIFASTSGDLPLPDLGAFLDWIRSGKAFIGIHAATDTFKQSDAYIEMIGGCFAGHPWNSGGEHAFVVHDPGHPVAGMFGERFRWKDEIYQYDLRYKPEALRVLVSLDMAASHPKEPWHVPVAWVREYGKGRVFSTNFGHNDATWREPRFQKHIEQGIAWALGRHDAPAEPNPDVQAAEYVRSAVAAAAAVVNKNTDDLLAKANAKIAANPAWATGLRPMLLEIRGPTPADRAAVLAQLVAEIEKP
jgi:type 1 glutamine amidotransferase